MRQCYFCKKILQKSGMFCQECQKKIAMGKLIYPRNGELHIEAEIAKRTETSKGEFKACIDPINDAINSTKKSDKEHTKLVTCSLEKCEAQEDAIIEQEGREWEIGYSGNIEVEKKTEVENSRSASKTKCVSNHEIENEIIRILKPIDFGLNAYGIRRRSIILSSVDLDRFMACLGDLCKKRVVMRLLSRKNDTHSIFIIDERSYSSSSDRPSDKSSNEYKYSSCQEDKVDTININPDFGNKNDKENHGNHNISSMNDRQLREFLDNHRDCPDSLAVLLHMDAKYYAGWMIEEENLTFRVNRVLKEENIFSVKKLLEMSPQALMMLKTFGLTSLLQVVKYLLSLIHKDKKAIMEQQKKAGLIRPLSDEEILFIIRNADRFAANEYEELIIENSDSERLVQIICNLQINHDWIDYPLLRICLTDPDKAKSIRDFLGEFVTHVSSAKELECVIKALPEYKRSNQVSYYIAAYKGNLTEKNQLKEVFAQTDGALQDVVQSNAVNKDNLPLILRFLRWCAFDPVQEIEDVMKSLFIDSRTETIIRLRTEGKTLDQVGQSFKLSRERIRQIEKKTVDKFHRNQKTKSWLLKVCADRNGDLVLTRAELSEYCGDYTAEVIYLLKAKSSTVYKYSKTMDVFIIASDGSEENRVRDFCDKLPGSFSEHDLQHYLAEAHDNEDLSSELVETYIKGIYTKTNDKYIRSQLRRVDKYRNIMQMYFPNGLRIYDEEQLRLFRMHYIDHFGEADLPSQDRAIGARISDLCILCDRGTYKLKQGKYISDDLTKEIEEFIAFNRSPVLPVSYVYKHFEDRLQAENIGNMYYLLGILHVLFDDRFYIRKHYVSAQKEGIDVYGMILRAIRESKKPVSQETLMKLIPGLAQVTVSMAVDSPDILNYWGKYLYVDNTRASVLERRGIEKLLRMIVDDGQPHDGWEIYNRLSVEYLSVLQNNYVYDQYSCFSLLQYWYKDQFNFVRPYISSQYVTIEKPSTRLHNFVYSKDEITIDEISAFFKEIGYDRISQLSYAKKINDRFFLVSNMKLVAIDKLGIDEQLAKQVETIVFPYVNGTMPIRDLPCYQYLPRITAEWTDWLVYSVLRKWSTILEVGESYNQIRLAVPLVAKAGEYDTSVVFYDSKQQDSFSVDDLSKLDELLEDMIEWEDLEND